MTRLTSMLLTLLALAGCAPEAAPPVRDAGVAPAATRPAIELATTAAYDFSAIPVFAGDREAIYAHIDANLDAHLAAIQRWLRQPSISAQNVGITEMATMLRDDLAELGFVETALVPTAGHPGVFGIYDAGAPRTLVVYMMYDVQPVNEEDWQSPPFAAELIEHELGRVLMARGATNQKGPQRAFLNALQSILAVEGTLPVNVIIAAEGEEELGSPNYGEVIDAYEDRLRAADAVLFPFNSQTPDGKVSVILGVKGIVYFELSVTGGDWGGPAEAEIHGSYKAIVDAPAIRLVQALASLTSPDGNTILVPGYYDDVVAPTIEESQLLNAAAEQADDAARQKALGVSRWIDDKTGVDAALELLYRPTLNIDGIWGGYTGEGVKTILPHRATAKVDSRLPPAIDPDTALARIRAHLDANGFDEVRIDKLSGYPAAQTSVSAPAVQAALSVFKKYASEIAVAPRIAGSAPFYQFTDRLGLPLIPAGLGYGTGAHAPNEIMLIEPAPGVGAAGLADLEKGYVDFVYALASGDAEGR